MIWRRSLIGYCKAKGADTSVLEAIDSEAHREVSRIRTAAVFIVATVSIIYAVYSIINLNISLDETVLGQLMINITIMIGLIFLMLFVIFVSNMDAPYEHEKKQVRFTEELSAILKGFDVDIPPMELMVKENRPLWFHILLLALTASLYTWVIFINMNRRSNTHIYNQWKYEDELLKQIIIEEDGTGIRFVKSKSKIIKKIARR